MLYDQIRLFEAGLSALGHNVSIGDRIAPNAVNLMWENFRPGQARLLRESGVVYGIVATEIPDGSGFNWRRDDSWGTRWDSFPEVSKGAAFIWALVEQGLPTYSQFAPSAYLEIGCSDRLVPAEAHLDPEFDFAFFGQINAYRQSVLDAIGRHSKVRTPRKILMPGELSTFIGQCRVAICFRHSPNWPVPSATRLGLILHARRGVAAEYTPVSTRQSSIVPMAPKDANFPAFCLEQLTPSWRRDAENAYERYRALLPMERLMEKILDETVLANSRVRTGIRNAPDEARVEIPNLFPPEIVLELSYSGYNIVRVGGRTLVAIAQSLGEIDINGVLSGRFPLPPAHLFIIGSDADELKSAVDDALKPVGGGADVPPAADSPIANVVPSHPRSKVRAVAKSLLRLGS